MYQLFHKERQTKRERNKSYSYSKAKQLKAEKVRKK